MTCCYKDYLPAMKMPVAVISSTIAPSALEHYGGNHSRWSPAERLEQTRASIRSLLDLGIEEIHLADNSGANWRTGTEDALRPAHVQVFSHYQYRNKGLSEIQLLLAALPRLPTDRPIVKLSGRYRLSRRLDQELGDADFVTREASGLRLLRCHMDTVAYTVRDVSVLERFLRETRRDVFGFPARVVGPGSLLRIVRNSLFPRQDSYPYDDPVGDIEHAAWRAKRKCGYRTHALASLGVEGFGGQAGVPVSR